MPIIPQTLNINNLRTTRAKSINLHTIITSTEYSFKKVLGKATFTPIVYEILLFECRSAFKSKVSTWVQGAKEIMVEIFTIINCPSKV